MLEVVPANKMYRKSQRLLVSQLGLKSVSQSNRIKQTNKQTNKKLFCLSILKGLIYKLECEIIIVMRDTA